MMEGRPKPRFPEGSLLAAMLGEDAPIDARRAARRLRSEGAPAVAVDPDIAALARGLASADIACSPAVLESLPPLFWLEAGRAEGPAPAGTRGWVVERKRDGLAVRAFAIAAGRVALPEPEGTATVPFGAAPREEEDEVRTVRGLVAAVALPEMLSQMGEASPVLLMPAEAPGDDARALRGLRLSVAVSPGSVPGGGA